MPPPAGVTHVVFGGNLPAGEHWQSGFWIEGAAPTTAATANALCALVLSSIMTNDSTGFGYLLLNTYGAGGYSIEYCRSYSYTGGSAASIIGEHIQEYTGLLVAPRLPNQVCLVASLRTGLAGRRHRGRMYLPIGFLTLDADGQVPASDCSAIAEHVAGFFNDWNSSGDNGTIVVVSLKGVSSSPVTEVIVDSRMDIQRRRAASSTIEFSHSSVVT